jgi:transcriptional regulator with XRE-family HTH domain
MSRADDLDHMPSWPPDLSERLSDFVGAMRREADFSQREFGAAAGVPMQTIARLESGATRDPRLSTLTKLASAAGYRLLLWEDGRGPLSPLPIWRADCRDFAQRRFPAHLDLSVDSPDWRPWWIRRRTNFTFARDRRFRDEARLRALGDLVRDYAEKRGWLTDPPLGSDG